MKLLYIIVALWLPTMVKIIGSIPVLLILLISAIAAVSGYLAGNMSEEADDLNTEISVLKDDIRKMEIALDEIMSLEVELEIIAFGLLDEAYLLSWELFELETTLTADEIDSFMTLIEGYFILVNFYVSQSTSWGVSVI